MPCFSIIISGFKNTTRQTVERCLALDTTAGLEYELILADNTPAGVHRTLADELFRKALTPKRCLYVPHPVPGKTLAQNAAIRKATGDIYLFVDDDVLPEQDILVEYDRAFAEFDVAAVQGRVRLKFEDGAVPPRWLNARFRLDLAEMDFGRAICPFEMGLTGANMAIKRGMFEKYGLFDERLGPAKTGTLEDQEFSERIRAGGERQLFWPDASVWHRIPASRLRLGSFARIYYDVGYSDILLSRHLVRGGAMRFSCYACRQCVRHAARLAWYFMVGRSDEAVASYCQIALHIGQWRHGVKVL